jgi:DNA repair exonuclease SbcCD ATPase subunit
MVLCVYNGFPLDFFFFFFLFLLDELRQRLDVIKEQVKELQKKKRSLRDKLTSLYEEHQKNTVPLNELFDLRAEMRRKLTQYRQEVVLKRFIEKGINLMNLCLCVLGSNFTARSRS